MVTYGDLMSLLLTFFVLLLSFSEIDAQKFKQIAGELSAAFGVQREVPALEIPMGTSPIFDKFSPGKPEPTPVDSVRQQTTEQDPKLETLREELEADVQKQVQDTTKQPSVRPKKTAPEPIDVVDGIPDHSPCRSRRYLPIVFGLFALWIAFLLYCLLGGRV